MTDRLDDKLRAHYALLGQQPMPASLEERLLARRRRATAPRWRGLAIGIVTAAAVFAIIAVPLLARLHNAPGPATAGTTTLGGIRAEFVKLVNTDSAALNSKLTDAERVCSGSAAQQTGACLAATSSLSAALLHANTDFNAATVPGGVAAEMAQLVQALGAFATAQSSGSNSATTVMADATTVETDLQALQHALAAT